MKTFKELGLSEETLKGINALGFETPSDIQEQAIPLLLNDDVDFIGLAQTGTGKTAAFGLPLVERVDPFSKFTQALVLAPTRELGQQIAEQLVKYSAYLDKVNVLAVYGGAAISTQISALRKTQHIIIATPGRLIDLIERKAINLSQLQFLVLDEADEMLNMGFKDELDKILSFTPKDKLTWLFSATMPNEIKRIVNTYMTDPMEVKVNQKNEVNVNIEHQFVVVRPDDKTEALMRFMDIDGDMRGVVFCRTKRDTQNLAEELLKRNYKADALHGDLSQQQRDRVMKRFKSHDLQVLIATDVAARGIDVNDLTHVFHFSLPDDNSYYTHRSGRTARAGKKGVSIAFVSTREQHKIDRLQKQLSISFSKRMIPSVEDIVEFRLEKWCQGILDIPSKGKLEPAIIMKANNLFGNLTKEEIIAKLLVKELERLNLGKAKDLNSHESKSRDKKSREKDRDRDKGRGNDRFESRSRDKGRDKDKDKKSDRDKGSKSEPRDRKTKSKKGDKPRFFINVGSRDQVGKHDLIDFICTVAKVNKKDLGNVDIQKSYSFFEVDETASKKISERFKGYTLEDGRELRVNRDN